MSTKIDLSDLDLGKEIDTILLAYNRDLQNEVNDIVKEVAKEGAKKLKSRSPKKTGKYASGWTTHTSTKADSLRGATIKTTTATIYNKNKPTLTHLLEYDHTNRKGGKVKGQPHIEPTAKEIEQELYNKVLDAINKVS